MKKLTLLMSVASLVVLSVCANVDYITPAEECRSLTGMNVCENTKEQAKIPDLDIKGDKDAKDYPEYY
jgi:hypothetical protein